MIRWPKIAILTGFLLAGSQAFAQEVESFNKTLRGFRTLEGLDIETQLNYTPITNLSDWKEFSATTDNDKKLSKSTLLQPSTTSVHLHPSLPAFSEPRSFVCDLEDFLSRKANVLIDIGPE